MKNIYKYYLVAFFFLSDFVAFAQPGDDDGSGGGIEGNDPQPAPIDSMLIYLIMIGACFALYTFRKNKNQV